MALNPYVNFHGSTPEQTLIDSIIVESIRMYGYDMQYIPRVIVRDPVMNESRQTKFTTAFPIEMYIKSVDGFGGDGMFLSNFGIEIRHQLRLTVAISSWNLKSQQQVLAEQLVRPKEGDLLYFAMDHKLLEIKSVNQYGLFYQTGTLQTYDITAEVFEYASEEFDTGIAAVDGIGQKLSLSTRENGELSVNDQPFFNQIFDLNNEDIDEFADNVEIDDAADELIDYTVDNPFSLKF